MINMNEQTLAICEDIVSQNRAQELVKINDSAFEKVADIIKEELPQVKNFWGEVGFTAEFETQEDRETYTILYELIGCAINYNYWFGCPEVRPCNASSTKMSELLLEAFNEADDLSNLQQILNLLNLKLNENRFPNLRNRIDHLREIAGANNMNAKFCEFVKTNSIEKSMYWLTQLYPGFSEDMFLKRANLFFGMLHRRLGYFKDEVDKLIVPADYHIPNVLRHYGCLKYHFDLDKAISRRELIPENSIEECAIRASTILACKKISELAGCTMTDVDTVLFLKRNEPQTPFHLTITTNY